VCLTSALSGRFGTAGSASPVWAELRPKHRCGSPGCGCSRSLIETSGALWHLCNSMRFLSSLRPVVRPKPSHRMRILLRFCCRNGGPGKSCLHVVSRAAEQRVGSRCFGGWQAAPLPVANAGWWLVGSRRLQGANQLAEDGSTREAVCFPRGQ
jgi:hypothetical protein